MRILTMMFGLCAALPALANPCEGLWLQSLEEAQALIERTRHAGVTLEPFAHVRPYEYLREGTWHIVWIEPDAGEPGAYFLQTDGAVPRFLDAFGGVAAPEEIEDVERWALALDKAFPPALAQCFAWYVTIGRYEGPPTRKNPFN